MVRQSGLSEFQLSLDEFLDDWEHGLIVEVVTIKNMLVGKSAKGVGDSPTDYKIVWSSI